MARRATVSRWFRRSRLAETRRPASGVGLVGVGAHRPAYVATVSLEKTKALRGPKLFLAAAPCPTGWEFDPARTMDVGRLQVETGLFPLKEAVGGESVVHTYAPRTPRPVAEYLRGQSRFRHLFEPVPQGTVIARIQAEVDRYWASVEAAP